MGDGGDLYGKGGISGLFRDDYPGTGVGVGADEEYAQRESRGGERSEVRIARGMEAGGVGEGKWAFPFFVVLPHESSQWVQLGLGRGQIWVPACPRSSASKPRAEPRLGAACQQQAEPLGVERGSQHREMVRALGEGAQGLKAMGRS